MDGLLIQTLYTGERKATQPGLILPVRVQLLSARIVSGVLNGDWTVREPGRWQAETLRGTRLGMSRSGLP